MSDTDAGDDDGFDREAEKERLREKYEQEKQDRQATQRMSELLLKGATMTNKHCDDCGNPIFRYDGQEFCSVCDASDGQAAGDQEAGGDQQAAGQQQSGGQQQTGGGQQQSGSQQETGSQQGDARQPSVDGEQPSSGGRATDEPATRDVRETSSGDGSTGRGAESSSDRRAEQGQGRPPARAEPSVPARADDLSEARASLARSVTEFARRAEETRDVGHARDLLAAAREAAEALAELERLR